MLWEIGNSSRATQIALALAVVATGTLVGAWYFQLVLDIKPCPLCLEQRCAYYAIVPLALIVASARNQLR